MFFLLSGIYVEWVEGGGLGRSVEGPRGAYDKLTGFATISVWCDLSVTTGVRGGGTSAAVAVYLPYPALTLKAESGAQKIPSDRRLSAT